MAPPRPLRDVRGVDGGVPVSGVRIGVGVVVAGPGGVLRDVPDGEPGEAGRETGQEGDESDGGRRADGGGRGGRGFGEDRAEGRQGARGGEEGRRDERGIAPRGDGGQHDGGDQHGDAAEQELQPARPLTCVRADDAGAREEDEGQGAQAERDGREAVRVDPGADPREGGEQHSGGSRDDAGQAVHVVADRVGGPEDEAEQDEQQRGPRRARAAQQVVAPQVAVAGDGRGDGVRDVVEHGGRQRVGERSQAEDLAVEHLLGREGAGAVEDGAVTSYQVVPGGGGDRLGPAGEAEDLRADVGDGEVVGQCDVDPAVGCHDCDTAEAGRRGRTHVSGPPGRRLRTMRAQPYREG